jgi:hypothetical protein
MGANTRTTFFFVVCSGLLLIKVSVAHSEIYQCDGKWTNKPCAGAIEKTIHESAGQAADAGGEPVEAAPVEEAVKPGEEALEPLAPRYALTRKLRKTNKEFSQKHNVSLTKEELHAFDERCTKRETPFSQCQAEHDAYVRKLNEQAKQKK